MIYVIESHADDAFLSLGGHIEAWVKNGTEVCIVTVYSGTRKRAADAYDYAKAVGAMWLGLGYTEAGGGLKCEPKRLPEDVFDKRLSLKNNKFVVPLSIGHPEHAEVRRAAEEYCYPEYYLDMPYAITQKLHDSINDALVGMHIVSYLKPSARKWRHIPLFKDQQLFFRYNPLGKLQETFELIVRKP